MQEHALRDKKKSFISEFSCYLVEKCHKAQQNQT